MNWVILELLLIFLPFLAWAWWEQRSCQRYLDEKARREEAGEPSADE